MKGLFSGYGVLSRAATALLAASVPWVCPAQGLQALEQAVTSGTPILNVRARYEDVGQVPLAADAVALTLRARVGIETAAVWDTSLLVEGNFLVPLIDNYRVDNAVPANARYPLVPDPRDHQLNRLQLTNTSLPGTRITLGRQVIDLDDQRFVGDVGWRQDQQTFDGLRIVNTSIPKLTVDAAYVNRVHRVYGPDSPQGTYRGDLYLGNVSYRTPLGKLTGFAYLLSFDPLTAFPGLAAAAAVPLNPARQSTNTYGGRLSDVRGFGPIGVGYVLSYASQRQRGDNPLTFNNDYLLAEGSMTYREVGLTVGDEIMHGNGIAGLSTPLATVHRFDGWADKFLTTPANGLDNRYATLDCRLTNVGPFQTVSASATRRKFSAERINADYGSEWDLQAAATWRRLTTSIILADYRAAAQTPLAVAGDTRKFWVQTEFVW